MHFSYSNISKYKIVIRLNMYINFNDKSDIVKEIFPFSNLYKGQ